MSLAAIAVGMTISLDTARQREENTKRVSEDEESKKPEQKG